MPSTSSCIHDKGVLTIVILALLTASCSQAKEGTSNNNNRPKKPEFVEMAELHHQVFSPIGGDDFNTALGSYVQAKYPDSKIKGFAEEIYAGNMYLIAVDISSSAKDEIIHVIGRIFRTSEGSTYWKMERPTYDVLRVMRMIERNQNEQNSIDNVEKKYNPE